MTRLTLIATAAFVALPGLASADEIVAYERSQLDDPAYMAQLHEKIESAAKRECKDEYRGEVYAGRKTNICIRKSIKQAMAKLDQAKQVKFAEAAS